MPWAGRREKGEASQLPQELNNRFHLSSREDLRVGLVAYGRHGLPQASGEMHLLAEEADGAALPSVGVVHLGQLGKAVTSYNKSFISHLFTFI